MSVSTDTSNFTAITGANSANAAAVSGAQPATPPPANPNGDMSGVDTFMKLLVAELKQQDPTDPVQGRDMVAQLAQLSGVQKLSSIDDKIGTLNTDSLQAASVQSAGLIGKTVGAKTNRIALNAINSPTGSYQLQTAANDVKVDILDSTGTKVRSLDLQAQKAGAQTFQWDGKGEDQRRVAAGSYTFLVSATDAKGNPVTSTTQVSGLVTEVTYENGAPAVVVAGAHVSLADVTSIAQ